MKKNKVLVVVLVVLATALALGYLTKKRCRSCGMEPVTAFKHPVLPPAEFNKLLAAVLGDNALVWKGSENDALTFPDGSLDITKFTGNRIKDYLTENNKKTYFNRAFDELYASLIEDRRQKAVEKELSLTVVEEMPTDIIARFKDFKNVPDQEIALYRDAIKKLMEAAPIIKGLYQKQIGTSEDDRIKTATSNDRELFDRYGHPWCLADNSILCTALPTFPKRTSSVIPDDVTCDKANKVGSPFEAVVKDANRGLKAVPYFELWPEDHKRIAVILKEAAVITGKIPREHAFTEYLNELAKAFESREPYPYARSDVAWADFLSSGSILYARIGADEVGGDGVGDSCESRARFHFSIGIKNQSAQEILDRIRPTIDTFEKKFADLVADPKNYIARKVKVQLPTFIDVIYANGDDVGGPSGTPVGQTLPNWCGADGKGECMHGTMIYVNKSLKAYSDKVMKQYIMPLFDSSMEEYFDSREGLDSVVYHEMFHNLGPHDKLTKPGSRETYGQGLTTKTGESWRLPIEEAKAQTGSLFMANEFYKEAIDRHAAGKIDDKQFLEEQMRYRRHITYDMAWALRMILRASRSGPEFNSRSPYSRLAAVQIGFLTEQGALIYNNLTKQWSIDFNKMPDAITALMKKLGQLYVTSNVDEIEKMFLYYMKGDGEKLLHRDRILEVAGKMPSVLFDYQLKGIN